MEEPLQNLQERIQDAADSNDAESSKNRPEKDPQKRMARKQNKRQKYKERQAQKSQEKPVANTDEVLNPHVMGKTKETDVGIENVAKEEESEGSNATEAPKSMSELVAQLQREEEDKKRKILELISRGEYEMLDSQDLQSVRDKKRVYSAWIGEVGDQNKRAKIDPVGLQMKLDARDPKEEKQHRGLRCKKCFCLLAKDEDFEFRNGMLWVVRGGRGWDGLVTRGDEIFCQNLHRVGQKVARAFAQQRTFVPVLKLHKTTFKENFIDNPEYAGSDFIRDKPLKDL